MKHAAQIIELVLQTAFALCLLYFLFTLTRLL